MKTANLPTKIDRFTGEWRFLSNFPDASVTLWVLDGLIYTVEPLAELLAAAKEVSIEHYKSVEHAFQASKSLDFETREKFRYNGVTAAQAKLMGRAIKKLRPDWESLEANGRMVKVNVMRDLLLQKFTPSITKRRLLSTFSAVLVEGNNWHDQFWGVCDGTCNKGPHAPEGLNWLGILEMEIRSHYGLGAPLV
jgi:ribA/ribD-fused uncharacterized protein